MSGTRAYRVGCWCLALCLFGGGAVAQEGQTPADLLWFEVESNALSFGDLDPDIEPSPELLVVRVHSERAWALKLVPSPGLLVDTGVSVPMDRLYWRAGTTGPFVPLLNNSPVILASGSPTAGKDELILTEFLLRLTEDDPVGQYQYDLHLSLVPVSELVEEPDVTVKQPPVQTQNDTVVLTANASGIFECTFDQSGFDFGFVDVNGTDFGTPNVVAFGRNGTDTGGVYGNVSGSITWRCRSAPKSTVDLALASTAADHTGTIAEDHLEIRISTSTQGGITTGFQAFSSQAMLLTDVPVKNGANSAYGNLDLRLSVLDSDAPGITSWLVRIRAATQP